MSRKTAFSRRSFLQISGIVTGAAALGGAALALPDRAAAQGGGHGSGDKPLNRGRMFFTNELEFAVLSEAAERIFPKDENGPGAKDLAVPYFIDNQLAGAWGYHAREYTGGPFYPGAPTQGWQSPLLRRDVFKQGLALLNESAQTRHKKDFPSLSGAQMDAILKDCESGKLPAQGFSSALFFSLLRGAVLAGAYADPIYNGNNNMDGWRMKEYPGAQMAYTQVMESGKFEKIDPISLSSMQ